MEKIHIHIETLKNQGQVMTIHLRTDIPGMEKISSASLLPEDSILGKEVGGIIQELKKLQRAKMQQDSKKKVAEIKKKRKLTASKKK